MGVVDENVFAKVPLVKRPSLLKAPYSPAEVQVLSPACCGTPKLDLNLRSAERAVREGVLELQDRCLKGG
jgi:hypothetical protein